MNQKSLWLCFCFWNIYGNTWNKRFTKVQQQHDWNNLYPHLQTALGCANKTSQNWWHGFESYFCHKIISSTCTYIHSTYSQIQGQTFHWCKILANICPPLNPNIFVIHPLLTLTEAKTAKSLLTTVLHMTYLY